MRNFHGLPIRTQLILSHRKKVPHLKKQGGLRHNTKIIKGGSMMGTCGGGAFISKDWVPSAPSGGRIQHTRKHLKPLVFRK